MTAKSRISELFITGEKVRVTGKYILFEHIGTFKCNFKEKEIKLKKGELFPVHKPCNKGAIWELKE
ncbi:MAG: YjzC family protein [Nanoarchaeota archaeon]